MNHSPAILLPPTPSLAGSRPTPLAWVDAYCGWPFQEKGRTRDGVDCWGFVRLVLQERYGIEVPSYLAEYRSTKQGRTIGQAVQREVIHWTEQSEWRRIDTPQEGDVVLLLHGGLPNHIGVMVNEELFLHVEHGINSTWEWIHDRLWRQRLEGFYRHCSR